MQIFVETTILFVASIGVAVDLMGVVLSLLSSVCPCLCGKNTHNTTAGIVAWVFGNLK